MKNEKEIDPSLPVRARNGADAKIAFVSSAISTHQFKGFVADENCPNGERHLFWTKVGRVYLDREDEHDIDNFPPVPDPIKSDAKPAQSVNLTKDEISDLDSYHTRVVEAALSHRMAELALSEAKRQLAAFLHKLQHQREKK